MSKERTPKPTEGRPDADARLMELEAREQVLLDRIDDAYYEVDLSGTFTLVNRAFADLVGIAVEEIVDSNFADYFDSDQYKSLRKLFGDVYETGTAVKSAQWQFNGVRGAVLRAVEGSIELLRNPESGTPRGFHGIVRALDTTSAKGGNDESLLVLFEEAGDAILVTGDSGFVEVNQAALELLGYSRQEFETMTPADIIDADHLREVPFREQELRAGKVIRTERIARRKNGETFSVQMTTRRLSDGRAMFVMRDLSEEKRMQRRLGERDARLTMLFEESPEGIFVLSKDGTILDHNAAAEDMTLVGRTELIGSPFFDLYAPKQLLEDPPIAAPQKEGDVVERERLLARADGAALPVHLKAIALSDGTRLVRMRDISAEVAVREELQRGREAMERAQEIAHFGSWDWDIPNDVLTWSDETYRIFGLKPQELEISYQRVIGFVHQDDRKDVAAAIGRLTRGDTEYSSEHRIVRPDGSERIVFETSEAVSFDDSGKPIRIIGVCRDVTDIRRAEAALRERDARLTMLFEESPEAIFVVDKDRTILDHNSAAEILTQRSRPQLLGTHYLDIYDQDELARVLPSTEAIESGETISRERFLALPDGSRLPVFIQAKRLSDGTRMARLRNIEEEWETRQELDHSREVTERAQEIAHFGSWDWDIIEGTLGWSDEIYRIFGLQPQEFGATYEAFFGYIHPDDRESVQDAVNLAVAGDQDYSIEHRVVRPDGTERIVYETGEVTFDHDGGALRMIGVVHDVTDTRRAEAALRERDARLKMLFEESPDAILINSHVNGPIVDFNQTALKLLGRTREQMDGLLYSEVIDQDDLAERPRDSDAVLRGETVSIDRVVIKPNGDRTPVNVRVKSMRDGTNLLVLRDLTEMEAAEAAIRDRDARLVTLIEQSPDAILMERDPQGIVEFNAAAVSLLGYEPDELYGRRYRDLMVPEQLDEMLATLERVHAGEAISVVRELIRADGGHIFVEVRSKQLPDKSILIVLRDVTDARRAAEALETSTARLRLLVEETDDAIIVTDGDRNIVEVNAAACKLLQRTEDDLKGSAYLSILAPGEAERTPIQLDAMSSERALHLERHLLRADGTQVICELRSKQLSDGTVMTVIRDLTEQKASEAAIRERDERLLMLLEESDDAILMTRDGEGIIEFNKRAVSLLGYEPEELYGLQYADLLHPDSQAGFRDTIARVAAGETTTALRKLFRKDGELISVEARAKLLPDGGTLVSLRDVTEREVAEAALKDRDARLMTVVEQSPDAILLLRDGQGVIEFNAAAVSMFGYEADQLLGRKYADFLAPGQMDDVMRNAALTKAGEEVNNTREFVRADGEHIVVEVRTKQMPDGNTLSVIRDVTEQLRLEEQLRQSQKLEAVGRLAGGIAHDFNNLLTVVNGYSGMILDQLGTDDEIYADLKAIQDAGIRGASLVSQLLEFTSQQMVNPELIDLNELLVGLSGMLRRLIGDDVELDTVTANQPVRAMVDRNQMEQVLMNLAVNARDAMPSGGRLTFTAETGTGAEGEPVAVIHVDDTGTGMPPEVAERIFEPFYTTKEQGKGTGLGLSSAHGIIAQADGQISVVSEVGHGARFTIRLPLAESEAPRAEAVTTILVVEDEADVRLFTSEVLRRAGYDVLEASNLTEAVTSYAENSVRVSLVLTDVVMPGGSGFETVRRLRGLNADLPVIYMSAHVERSLPNRQLLAKDRYLQKPFTPAKLVEMIRDITTKAALQDG